MESWYLAVHSSCVRGKPQALHSKATKWPSALNEQRSVFVASTKTVLQHRLASAQISTARQLGSTNMRQPRKRDLRQPATATTSNFMHASHCPKGDRDLLHVTKSGLMSEETSNSFPARMAASLCRYTHVTCCCPIAAAMITGPGHPCPYTCWPTKPYPVQHMCACCSIAQNVSAARH